MTHLPHNPQITVIDLPEDAKQCIIDNTFNWLHILDGNDNEICRPIKLDPYQYSFICLGNQATEGEAREIVQKVEDGYLKYGSVRPLMERLANMGNPWYADYSYYKTALQSLASLITANGWKNPVFLRKEN